MCGALIINTLYLLWHTASMFPCMFYEANKMYLVINNRAAVDKIKLAWPCGLVHNCSRILPRKLHKTWACSNSDRWLYAWTTLIHTTQNIHTTYRLSRVASSIHVPQIFAVDGHCCDAATTCKFTTFKAKRVKITAFEVLKSLLRSCYLRA